MASFRLEIAPGLGAPVPSAEYGRMIVYDMFGSTRVDTVDGEKAASVGCDWIERHIALDTGTQVACLIAFLD